MAFGISPTGFSRKTLQDILTEISADFKAEIGQINDADDSVFSQVIRPLATQLAEAWEALEAVYQACSVSGAAGVSLDALVSLNFLFRLEAQSTEVLAAITGDIGTVVPSGNRASISETGDLFAATADVEIDPSNALRIVVTVETAAAATEYTVTLDGVAYSATSPGSGMTVVTIAAQLVAVLEAAGLFTVVDNLDGSFSVTALDLETAFSAAVGARLALTEVSSPQTYAAVETGAIACPTGKLDTIENPVTGFGSLTNFGDGTLGRAAETDKELRTRRLQALARAGKSTVAAILAKLISGDVAGVTQAYVYENIQDITDGAGRPPHSIEAVVQGGEDEDVAQALHAVRAGGIQTYGNANGGAGISILDAQGYSQVVKFSRPVSKYAWVMVAYELYDEEIFPADGEAQMAANLLAFGLTHTIGKDFLQQRFIGECTKVPGVGRVTLTIAVTSTPGGTPSYGATDIAVGAAEVLDFDTTRITVAEAP